jgi:hypothetical protein
MKNKPKPGDWVRFYRDARMVIGVVQYVGPVLSVSIHGDFADDEDVLTDIGSVTVDGVLEIRGGSDAE